MKNNYSFYFMLLAIVGGIVGGSLFPHVLVKIAWLGEIFVNMLKLICLPLIFSALVSAIASMGNLQSLSKIGKVTLAYVFSSVSIAVLIGLIFINMFQPGLGIDPKVVTAIDYHITTKSSFTLITFLQGIFPDNIVAAAAKFQIMPVVVFAVVFAIACLSCGKNAAPVINFFAVLRDIFIKMINWLMVIAPIGLFALIGNASAHAVNDNILLASLKGIGLFVALFLSGLILQMLWQGVLVKIVTQLKTKHTVKAVAPAMMTAFATASSMATLPVAINSAQKIGLVPQTIRFVLPLATTINLSGTAMYEAVAAVFFCQILGIPLSVADQIAVFFIAIVAGMGATGIPEAGLVTMVSVLSAVNVPINAIALLLPFDRILDRCRTTVNVWGDLMCTIVVNHILNKRTN